MAGRRARDSIFWPEELRVLAPPERITVSKWADQFRVVGRSSPRPGQWSTDLVPFVREPMDCFNDPTVEEVTIIKGAQVAGTEALLNVIGYVIDQEPDPLLYVMPRDEDWDYISTERVRPMLEMSEKLAAHITDSPTDLKKNALRFDRCTVFFAGSNSPAGLASKPCRTVLLDEVDKYPDWTGREADPISLARARTKTFSNRKVFKISTPTTRSGLIWLEWERSDKRRFHVPCPHCGAWQHLVWQQVRFPADVRDPDELRRDPRVAYQCIRCAGAITDAQKRAAMARGVWVPEGGEVGAGGQVVGSRTASHRGYHVTGLLSPFAKWGELAAEWIVKCRDQRGRRDFTNGTLGEPYEEAIERTTIAQVKALVQTYERGTVPEGVLVLTAGADVQKREIYYEVRGWGVQDESWLIQAGRVERLADLEQLLVAKAWPRAVGRGDLRVRMACIDSGYRRDEVYALASRFSDTLRAVKGLAEPKGGIPIQASRAERDYEGRPVEGGLLLWLVDTSFFKDKLSRLIHAQKGDPGGWHVHAAPSEDWLNQIVAEQKVLTQSRGRLVERWTEVPGAGANHWLDCAVYSFAAAHMIEVHKIETVGVAPEEVAPVRAGRDAQERPGSRSRGLFGGAARGGGRRGMFGK